MSWRLIGFLGRMLLGLLCLASVSADDAHPPAAWTDPRIVDKLEKDCAYDPSQPTDSEEDRRPTRSSNPLVCEAEFEQACVNDHCFFEKITKCKPRCRGTCNACSTSCVAPCEACKRDCRDASCKRACALQCGQCHEACVRAADRCFTGTCAAEYKSCRAERARRMAKEGCQNICPLYEKIMLSCMPNGSLDEECFMRRAPKRVLRCDTSECRHVW